METAYQRLLRVGIRPSVQRVAILNYLMEHNTHPTIEDVYNDLKPLIPTVSKTTVYNTLRMFSEKNVARMITIDDHRVCYDGDMIPHAHFFCKSCGKVYDFDRVDISAYRANVRAGFRVDDTQLYYKGACPECLAKAKQEHN